MPPLAITKQELRRLLSIVTDAIAEVVAAAAGDEPVPLAA
jgi:adenosylmethionine-8-amino-7-oxononanoate aminotransferase